MKSMRTTIRKEIEVGPAGPGAPFPNFFIIHPRKKKLNQNDGSTLVHR